MTQPAFTCKKCGTCCLSAHFDEVHEEDVLAWKKQGRTDILAWVRFAPIGQGDYAYEVWIDPHTGRQADQCPWLRQAAGSKQYVCKIYDVRPTTCGYFPASLKHAEEVGCRAFEKNER